MFNKKRVKELEDKLVALNKKYDECFKKLNIAEQLLSTRNFSRVPPPPTRPQQQRPSHTAVVTRQVYNHIAQRPLQQPLIEAPKDVIDFAIKIRGTSPKRQKCGGGSCSMVYEVQANLIDSYANAKPKE